jgi:hypothetical protein
MLGLMDWWSGFDTGYTSGLNGNFGSGVDLVVDKTALSFLPW